VNKRPAQIGKDSKAVYACGIWLSLWTFVENKGSNWVRFVILFWVRHQPEVPRLKKLNPFVLLEVVVFTLKYVAM
jgi:hypothetical protein